MDDLPASPVLDAVGGALAAFGQRRGRVVRFDPAVSPFAAVPADATAPDWADLAALVGAAGHAVLVGPRPAPPPDWTVVEPLDGVQMDGTGVVVRDDPDAVEMGPSDRDAMRALVEATRPGPWESRTAELGRFLGLRRDGRLVALAGERMRGRGWTEISAVCTDPGARGQGLAERLVRAVAAGIVRRGDRPILHVRSSNEPALRVYRRLGFVVSRPMAFDLVRTPG